MLFRGIKAATHDFYEECSSHDGTPFEECMELVRGCSTKFKALTPSILFVKRNYFTEELATLFPALLWLRWVSFLQKALPSWLFLKNLRVLELPDAEQLEELWNDTADPPLELRELNLQGAPRFLRFPSTIGCLRHLKKISLNCWNYPTMGSLPEGFCLLESLEHLELRICNGLTSLPRDFGHLTNLRHLDLRDCSKLRTLPHSFKQLIHLQYISFRGCKELTLTPENNDIMENMTKLETLDFSGCNNLQKLPPHITNQLSLTHLYADWTGLRELPSNIGELKKLEVLKIGSPYLTTLPTSIENLSSLTCLEIISGYTVKTLPESIGHLSSLTSLCMFKCYNLQTLPKSIGFLSSLIFLNIYVCNKLKTLPESISLLSSLISLKIYECNKLETLPESIDHLSSLTTLEICSCPKLGSLPKNLGCLPEPVRSLTQLEEPSIKSTLEKSFPETSVQLGNLKTLTIVGCPITELGFLSGSFSFSLCNLKSICLGGTLVSRISISEQCCPSLETLELDGNEQLVEIETLPISVKAIELRECEMLNGISVLSGMVNLETLSIKNCGEKLETADQAKKTQGLENYRSAEKVRAVSWCNMAAINLEHTERLRSVVLAAACNISAISPCLQTIKKLPSESVICARTERGVGSVLKHFAFPHLTLVDSCVVEINNLYGTAGLRLKGNRSRCSNAAAMVCFDFNSTSSCSVSIQDCIVRVGEGRWVCIGVFTRSSLAEEYRVLLERRYSELRRGMLVMGEEERVVEAFKNLVLYLGGCEWAEC